MKAVLTALEGMGKASCREIAARLKKDVRVTMDILQNMEDRKEVTFVNGYWSIAGAAPMKSDITPVPRAAAAAPKTKPIPPAKERRNFREDILLILRSAGEPMFTAAIAEAMGRVPNAMNSTMAKMATEGLVVKHVDGRNITWSASCAVVTEKPAPAPAAQAAKPTSALVADIPVFTARANDLILPTSAAISSRLRRARGEVASLEELQVAVRSIRRRHGKLLRELAQ